MSGAPRSLTVFTHTRPADTESALRRVAELASEAGVELRLPAAEQEKFGLIPGASEATDPATDPVSGMPQFKVCAVSVCRAEDAP